MEDAINAFKKSHKDKEFKTENKISFVKLKRKVTNSKKLIENLVKNEYISGRSKKIKVN